MNTRWSPTSAIAFQAEIITHAEVYDRFLFRLRLVG